MAIVRLGNSNFVYFVVNKLVEDVIEENIVDQVRSLFKGFNKICLEDNETINQVKSLFD